jgi:hypothetical protein
LPSSDELESLGLGDTHRDALSKKVSSAAEGFDAVAQQQKMITAKSRWLHFGASLAWNPAYGYGGATRDVMVYDNVSAIVETEGKHSQIFIGTLVHPRGRRVAGDRPAQFDGRSFLAGRGQRFLLPSDGAAAAGGGGRRWWDERSRCSD